MSDQMRDDFEDFASDQYEWPQAIQKNADGEYKLMATAEAWRYWQASRAALVVELPKLSKVEGCHGVEDVWFPEDIIAAIQSVGVSVK